MKVCLIIASLWAFQGFAQDISTTLEGNDVRAHLSTQGIFFRDIEENGPGYEVPKMKAIT